MKYSKQEILRWVRDGYVVSAQVVLDLLEENQRLQDIIDFELLGLGVISDKDLELQI